MRYTSRRVHRCVNTDRQLLAGEPRCASYEDREVTGVGTLCRRLNSPRRCVRIPVSSAIKLLLALLLSACGQVSQYSATGETTTGGGGSIGTRGGGEFSQLEMEEVALSIQRFDAHLGEMSEFADADSLQRLKKAARALTEHAHFRIVERSNGDKWILWDEEIPDGFGFTRLDDLNFFRGRDAVARHALFILFEKAKVMGRLANEKKLWDFLVAIIGQ